MKKIFLLIMTGMTAITLYFLCFWEPKVEEMAINVNKNQVEEKKEPSFKIENSKESKEKGKIDYKKENINVEENKKEQEIKQEKEEKTKQEKEEQEKKNAQEIKNTVKKMKKEEQEKIISLLEKLSTADMLLINKAIEMGNKVEAKNIVRKRLLEKDSKIIFEIFGKYKEKN